MTLVTVNPCEAAKIKREANVPQEPADQAGYAHERCQLFASRAGFNSYQEWLDSREWKRIRGRILKNKIFCPLCRQNPATEVHRRQYDSHKSYRGLIPVCSDCYQTLETNRTQPQMLIGKTEEKLLAIEKNVCIQCCKLLKPKDFWPMTDDEKCTRCRNRLFICCRCKIPVSLNKKRSKEENSRIKKIGLCENCLKHKALKRKIRPPQKKSSPTS